MQARDRHRPDGRRADRDRGRVGQRPTRTRRAGWSPAGPRPGTRAGTRSTASPAARISRLPSAIGFGVAAGADRLGEAAGHDRRDAGEADEGDDEDREQDRGAVRRRQPVRVEVDPRLERERARHEVARSAASGRHEPQPERHEADGAEAGRPRRPTAGSSDSIGTPAAASVGGSSVGEHLERAEQHRDRAAGSRRARAPAARAGGTARRSSRRPGPGRVGPCRSSIAGMVRETVAHVTRPACRRPRRGASARRRVFTTSAGLDPCPPRLADAPADVVELVGPVGVRIDRQHAADADRPAGALDGEVEPVRRAVHLEHGPGARRLGVDRVPVEVEVVARADHPAGRMGDDVDVRAAMALSVRWVSSARGWRRTRGARRRRGRSVASRSSSKSSWPSARISSSQPWSSRKPLGRASPAGRVPAASSAANRALSVATISRCSATRSGVEAAGDGQRLRVVGQDLVRIAAPAGGLGHDLDRRASRRTSPSGCAGRRGGPPA